MFGPRIEEPFLPLCRPPLTHEDIAAVTGVLRSGWLTTGPRVADLEAAFVRTTGCRHAVAVSSATAGMHLLLHGLGIGPGDEVITPSLTWVSTVNLVVLRGATPVFADVERDTAMTSARLVERCVTERTRLIVPVHFAGAALDVDDLRRVAAGCGAHLVEDAAHALGSACRDAMVGETGTAVFSLHPIKNVTTGEGGIICTADPELAGRARRLRFHGLEADAYDRETGGRTLRAEVLEPGFKYNLPDMNAALGIGQLTRLAANNARRAALAHAYAERLADIPEVLPLITPDYPMRHAWHLYVIRVDTERAGITREAFMAGLAARGIGTGLHFRAVHEQRFYRETMRVDDDRLANTIWNSARLCSLPLFPDMRETDVARVVDAIKSVLRRSAR